MADMKKVMQAKGDQIALIASGLILAFAAYGFVTWPSPLKDEARVNAVRNQANNTLTTGGSKIAVPTAIEDEFVRAWKRPARMPETLLDGELARTRRRFDIDFERAPEGATPTPSVSVSEGPTGPTEFVITPPENLQFATGDLISNDIRGVNLLWVTPMSSDQIDGADIAGYVVERRSKGRNWSQWEQIALVEGVQAYTDTSLAWDRTYQWRVWALLPGTQKIKSGLSSDHGERIGSDYSNVLQLKLSNDATFKLHGRFASSSCDIEITKYFKIGNDWVPIGYRNQNCKVLDQMGIDLKVENQNQQQRALSKGIALDFVTNYQLGELTTDKANWTWESKEATRLKADGTQESYMTHEYFYDEVLVAKLHFIDPITGRMDKKPEADGGKAKVLQVSLKERQREISAALVPADVRKKAEAGEAPK
jgi:hypothetical protein